LSGSDGQRQLETFWKTALRVARGIALIGAVILYAFGGRPPALGLLLGSLVSILRFQMRHSAMRKGPTTAALVRLRLIGYGMSAAALALAFAFRSVFSPWTTAPGLLVMNVSVVVAELLCRREDARARTPGNT
jgi:hypothetical protein